MLFSYVLITIDRDNNGELLNAWEIIVPLDDPLVVETTAIQWDLGLAIAENYPVHLGRSKFQNLCLSLEW